jgi:Tol biopolymer transport system component
MRDIEIQTATGDYLQLTHGGGVQGEPPAWSPAGDKIAYVESTVENGFRETSELFIAGTTGSCSIEIGIAARLGPGRLFGPAWVGSEKEPAFDRCE